MSEIQIESLKVMEIKSGDVIVVKLNHSVDRTELVSISREIKYLLPFKDVRVIILQPGMDIGVLRETG